jgi:hypothetical protein
MNWTPTFEEFWKAYPLHRARGESERVWNKMTAKDKRAAFAGIAAYREACKRTGAYFKYASGWLADRRWEDEAEAVEPKLDLEPHATVFDDMETW